jgi:hypothetical protein
MFDWQPYNLSNTSTSSQTVSRSFWIYWAIAIPLTVVIGLAWRLWWLVEERKYDRQVAEAMEGLDGVDERSDMEGLNGVKGLYGRLGRWGQGIVKGERVMVE